MSSDSELMQRFVQNGEQDALTEIVRRHVDLVYSAALRQTGGDAHFATDVSQKVFLDLVRKARTLRDRPRLEGWLYTSTHYVAANLVRAERRRRKYEQEAQAMSDINSPAPHVDWALLQPVLDEAVLDLGESDRQAILLRYFQQKPLAEVGRVLGVSENTAAKRVERALEELRRFLTKRGIASTGSALGLALVDQAVVAAPAGLASGISAAVLASSGGVAAWLTFSFMATKTYTIGIAVLVLGGAGLVLYQQNVQRELRSEVDALRAQNDEATAKLKDRDAALASTRAELEKIRADALRNAQKTEITTPARQPSALPAAKTNVIAVARDVGRATPSAAFETAFWAILNGDFAVASDSIHFAGEDAVQLKVIFDGLSESARTSFGTPEKMGAAVLLSLVSRGTKETGFAIVDELQTGPDDAVLKFHWNDDPRVRPIPLRRVNGQWKVVLTDRGMGEPKRQLAWREMAESMAVSVQKHAIQEH